ncbi:MAG: magnesium-translocating P-type ATPase, partial [Actinomycetota bacterium]
ARGACWSDPVDDVPARVGSAAAGLGSAAPRLRLDRDGPNVIAPPPEHLGIRLFLRQFSSPILLVLVGATALSMALGEVVDGIIILAIIAASAVLGFSRERSAGQAVQELAAQVRVEVEVFRDGEVLSLPIEDVVVGDVLALRAGDVIAADARVLSSRDLLVDEAALTGESYPRHKTSAPVDADAEPKERASAVFQGSHVVSGSGAAVVVAVGDATEFGRISAHLASGAITTGFERGIAAFGQMLVRVMLVLVGAIFVVNLVLERPVVDAFLFSLALAVGLTPQLLPAIVSVSLAAGARAMAERRVIVKRLDAIEDLGGMTVLCTDKTGTLTVGAVELDAALDVRGDPDPRGGHLAARNAGLQRGFPNPLDAAILRAVGRPEGAALDEIPYDFERRRLSVLVEDGARSLLVTKGAVREVLGVCTRAAVDGREVPLDDVVAGVEERFAALGDAGLRVLAVATRTTDEREVEGPEAERDLVLRGFLTFRDPAKPGALEAITRLADHGCSVRIVTGDARRVAAEVAGAVGLVGAVLTGAEIAELDDAALADRAAATAVFAEVEPLQKERIVRAFRERGEVVGFLGDGINDVVALHAADVGISVDSAVDVAKRAAAIVLLDKSLDVLDEGMLLGRRTFANTLKYVRVTISANFGNMLSLAAASAFLPFLPLLPRQILLLNFLSDIPGLAIAGDAVDPEQVERPSRWSIVGIRRFMIAFGLVSTAFDLATFATLRLGFGADATLFRSGWFVESTLTELVAMLVLRTWRPAFRSRPGRGLLWLSVGVAVVTATLPFSPLRGVLGLVGLPAGLLLALAALTAIYWGTNELLKARLRAGVVRGV